MWTRSDKALVAGVMRHLRASVVPERRDRAAGYVPSSMEVLGVPVPELRKALRPVARELGGEPVDRVLRVARSLIDTGTHEARQIAYELIGRRRDVVAGLDGAAVEELGTGNDNWASVDALGVFVSGPAWRDGLVSDEDVHRWARSEDPWWRRTALVSTVPLNVPSRGGTGDTPRTLAVCTVLAGDRHPMVAKALSWALRSLTSSDAPAVGAFLERHGEDVAALVRREVRNKLATGRKNPGR